MPSFLASLTTLIHDAITFALQYLDDNHLVDFSDFDDNSDGFIDSITLLHSGNGAEWGGRDAYDSFYTDRIWSHKWALSAGPFTSSSGVKVRAYHISPAVWGRKGSSIGRIGVIAHETGHFLGLPDLYDVNGGGNGIGSYGLMANSWGFDGSQYFPPYLSAWSRLQLGWATATAPLEGINYIETAANQDATYPRVYKIDEGFPTGEYLLIENRQAYGYDTPLPQGGLAIYHIDESADFKTEGYPGQPLWPENGNHYLVALLQADGNYDLEKGEGRGEGGDVFHGSGVSSLAPSFLQEPGPFPNTDSYQGGLVVSTSVYITEISNSSDVMSFEFHVGLSKTASPSTTPISTPSTLPTTSPSRTPTTSPTTHPTEAPTSAPSMSTALPSSTPIGEAPSAAPTTYLTSMPTTFPTESPKSVPSLEPTKPAVCLAKGDKCGNDSECCSSSKCKGKRRRRKCN
jgi:M6 family metalloprotease-like protein